MVSKIQTLRRKAVAGIVAAMLLFTMIFTTGTAYFLFMNNTNFSQQAAATERLDLATEQRQELYSLASLLVQGTGKIGFNITSQGPSTIKMVLVTIRNSSTLMIRDGGPGGQTSPNLPIYVNPGSKAGPIDTGVTPQSGVTYTIKAVTDRGTIAQASYPNTASSAVVAAALIAQSVGEIQMNFATLKWATAQTTPLTWNPASTIPGGQKKVVWRVNVTNHSHKDIFFGQSTVLAVIRSGGANTQAWYIIKAVNSSNGNITPLGASEHIQLQSNPSDIAQGGPPVMVYFTATLIGGSISQDFPAQVDVWFVLVGLIGAYTTGGSSDTFSQLIPFKAIRST